MRKVFIDTKSKIKTIGLYKKYLKTFYLYFNFNFLLKKREFTNRIMC